MRKKDHIKKYVKKTSQMSEQVQTHNKTIEDDFFFIGCILAAAAAAIAAISFFCHGTVSIHLPPCLFHIISGYYCPGCGGTRAVRALLDGHILLAVYYHPAVPYGAAIYLYFMATQAIERISQRQLRIGMHYHNIFVWIAVLLIIGNFILKNILHAYYGFDI